MPPGTGMALFAMGLGVLVIANDFTALNVALPAIEQDFDVDVGTIQWTINAYALTFGMVLVTGGRLADMFGRRRIFFIGTAIFAGFSLLGGLAQNAEQLIAMRVGMGVGGGLMWPAILGMTFAAVPAGRAGLRRRPDPRRRRARQRDRAADRRRAHRRAQLARDLLPQPPGRRLRRRRHRGEGPPAGRRGTARADRLRRDRHALARARRCCCSALDQSADWGWGDAARARRCSPSRVDLVRRLRGDRAADGQARRWSRPT